LAGEGFEEFEDGGRSIAIQPWMAQTKKDGRGRGEPTKDSKSSKNSKMLDERIAIQPWMRRGRRTRARERSTGEGFEEFEEFEDAGRKNRDSTVDGPDEEGRARLR
jgi:hypothetical protein